jgi:hypothetical protein
MNQYIVEMVQKSNWLKPHALDFLCIRESTPIHSVLEKIWLNVAASYGVKWQQIENATENETKLYSARIITMLLTISTLTTINKMKDYEVNILIGSENQYLIEDYFDYLKGKKS